MGFVKIFLVGWEEETVFCFRCVLSRVMLGSHLCLSPTKWCDGAAPFSGKSVPDGAQSLLWFWCWGCLASSSLFAWAKTSPQVKEYFWAAFKEMSAHFLLMLFLCLFSGIQRSFQPAAYKSHGCEWYFSHRRWLFKPEGTPRSPGSGKILRQKNCHEQFSLWFCPSDTRCGSQLHSICICGTHPLFLHGRAFSLSWVRLSFLPPQGIEQPVRGTLCTSKCSP